MNVEWNQMLEMDETPDLMEPVMQRLAQERLVRAEWERQGRWQIGTALVFVMASAAFTWWATPFIREAWPQEWGMSSAWESLVNVLGRPLDWQGHRLPFGTVEAGLVGFLAWWVVTEIFQPAVPRKPNASLIR